MPKQNAIFMHDFLNYQAMKFTLHFLSTALLVILLIACKKKNNTTETLGEINLKFENVVGNQPLVLNTQSYTNANGDSYKITKYAYYLTSLAFVKADGTSYTRDDLMFLVSPNDPNSLNVNLKNIPEGTYTKITGILGVDSIYNVSGAQDGALDPLHGMFWDWNTGYIMAKCEGFSPQSTAPANMLSIHLGGFKGSMSVIKRVTFDLPQAITVSASTQPIVIFESDVNKWFEGSSIVDFAQINSVMSIGRESYEISLNYHNHLHVKQVQN